MHMLMACCILYEGKDQLVSVDVEGNIQKIIPPPVQAGEDWPLSDYVGQSQGRLHYIYLQQEMFDLGCKEGRRNELIWVLEDYDTKQWVLKDTHCNRKLISYHMDSKEVSHLCTLGHGYRCITRLRASLAGLQNRLQLQLHAKPCQTGCGEAAPPEEPPKYAL
ncbi:uncharacterized protein LOC112881561 [Panicum hallii]|uniref:uncharacterized protein LOC112881561 n=1 Tax=Panicum hallii TaxID=206008 RepID=UPI000DF4D596|nr:uncharacterized protein LOC112881561 [Panicum hallii]